MGGKGGSDVEKGVWDFLGIIIFFIGGHTEEKDSDAGGDDHVSCVRERNPNMPSRVQELSRQARAEHPTQPSRGYVI